MKRAARRWTILVSGLLVAPLPASAQVPLFKARPITRTGTWGSTPTVVAQKALTVHCLADAEGRVTRADGGTPIVDNYMTAGSDSASICTGGAANWQYPMPGGVSGTNCFNTACADHPRRVGQPIESCFTSAATARVVLRAGRNDLRFKLWDWGSVYGNTSLVLQLPAGCSVLQLSKAVLPGCLKATGKLTLGSPAPAGGLSVTLRSDSPHVTVPPTVLFKAGAQAKSFSIATSAVTARETVTIEASVLGLVVSAGLTLKPMGPKSVGLLPNPIVGGNNVDGTVTLECPAGPGDIEVRLTSTKPLVAAPTTPSITVPVGTKVMPFTVTTNPVTAVTKPGIKAAANGVTKSKALVVNPAP